MPNKPPVKPGEPPIRVIDYTVNENGCWVWNWSLQPKGYATVQVNGRPHKAHRVAYELVCGAIPRGQMIRHLCGNPSCVNAEHLRPGTQTQNSRDMVESGTQHFQKLLPQDADDIRKLYSNGDVSQTEIARRYGVTQGTVGQIGRNKTFHDPDYIPPEVRKYKDPVNPTTANEIRRICQTGEKTQKEVAKMFDIHPGVVSNIVRNLVCHDPEYFPSIRPSPRKGTDKQREKTITRPILTSLTGPAPTGKEEQQRRREVRVTNRKPRRKPGDPLITENDWVLDPDTGCQNWRWGGNSTGHGLITSLDGKRMMAYRAFWEMCKGPIPAGKQLNHRCNNGFCINLDHLYPGDQFENMRDTVIAGNHATQKLTWKDAKAIRRDYEPRIVTYQELADKYGVTIAAIYCVINNKTFPDRQYTPKNPEVSVRRVLSELDAENIREKYVNARASQRSLAQEFGVSRSVIKGIVRNETYYSPEFIPLSPNEKPLWKLSKNDVENIRHEYVPRKVTHKQLANKYGVTTKRIKEILRAKDSHV